MFGMSTTTTQVNMRVAMPMNNYASGVWLAGRLPSPKMRECAEPGTGCSAASSTWRIVLLHAVHVVNGEGYPSFYGTVWRFTGLPVTDPGLLARTAYTNRRPHASSQTEAMRAMVAQARRCRAPQLFIERRKHCVVYIPSRRTEAEVGEELGGPGR